ncbi:MAG: DUF362 domain-containing protein [Acidobacteria bacterium]|nr:DUF362 domain-containing protein [Acidobacteriota bacterium]
MGLGRRQFLLTAGVPVLRAAGQAASGRLGIPGPYRGRVVAVEHPASIVSGRYQREPVRAMMRKGMMELTGAPGWAEAWRVFFEPGDVVGIKVNPVGQPFLISAPEVFQEIVAGLESAGVNRKDIVAYDRYQTEFLSGGFDKWLPEGVRWMAATTRAVNGLQLDMEGYDRDQYMEMALVHPKGDPGNPHHRRSYVARFLSKEVNKVVNLGVLKHHQSAGVTIALKNLSHGLVNNVARSHGSRFNNSCGMFIPTVVDLAVIRRKVVLNIIDGILGAWHGGPGRKVSKYLWENKTLYFGTDPVALDAIGLGIIDGKRHEAGMAPIALAQADQDSLYVRMQPEFIEIAGVLGLGESDESKIDLRPVKLT